MNGPLAVRSGTALPRLLGAALCWPKLLEAAPVACAWLAIGACALAAAFRLSYPFPLVSTEQATIEQVQRVLNGQPLYAAPSLQHVPLVYGPVYYYASSGLALLLGLSYLPLRLVSWLAACGTLALVTSVITRETGRLATGLVAAGLLAATYPVSGIFDIAHVDALFLFLLMASIALARTRTDPAGLVASGMLMGLAGLTKLPIGAAPVALALALYLAATLRARALAFGAGCVFVVALGLLVLRVQDGTWATWYLLNLPSMHVINNHGDGLGRFWFADILPRLTLPLLIAPLFLLSRAAVGDRRPLAFFGLVSLSLVGVAWAARSNSGGAPNVLAPGHLAIALLFGLGFDALLRLLAAAQRPTQVLRAYALALCVVQFLLLAYNPRLLVPYRSEQWAAERLSSTLTSMDGALFAPNLDGYLRGSAKGEQPLIGALLEITGSYGGPGTREGEQWKQDFATALQQRRFTHVVLVEDCCDMAAILSQSGYVLAGPLFPPGDDYWLWTNGRTPGDLQVFVPAETRPGAS